MDFLTLSDALNIINHRIMNGILKKLLTWLVLPAIIVLLVWVNVSSIMQPVKFNKGKAQREKVAIQNLKDIRDLEVAFKSVNNRFTASIDSLADFYRNGDMEVVMQIGSQDDSLAVTHTEAVKKANRGITADKLYEMYQKGDKNLVFSVKNKVPVRQSLFTDRTDFNPDLLKYIPFSDNEPVQMDAIVKTVSGVQVPLFEAKMPYKSLLKGMDNQLRINLDAERRDQNKYEGLQVGSVTAPNNNAGNWE